MPRKFIPIAERFWSKVDMSGECWTWMGTRLQGSGYGMFWLNGKNRPAHRVAWELTNGPISDGLLACHHCDNPCCVRPDHLFLGDYRDNARDMVEKDRSATSGDRHWYRRNPERAARGERGGARLYPERMPRGENHGLALHPERRARGERHGNAKVTAEQVIVMRRDYAAGGVTLKQLAAVYGIHCSVVSDIVKRRTWKHV